MQHRNLSSALTPSSLERHATPKLYLVNHSSCPASEARAVILTILSPQTHSTRSTRALARWKGVLSVLGSPSGSGKS